MNRLAAMETFVRVLDAGSFCAAARQLKIGQPAVSKSIAQLERRLGVRLLMRSTHGVSPTEAARKFYEHASVNPLCARGAGGWAFDRLASTPGDREVARNHIPAAFSKAARESETPICSQRGNPDCPFPLLVM